MHEFLPHSWNNGIVEQWNSGLSKDTIHFKLCRQAEFYHLPDLEYPKTHYSAKASLRAQYSNIPPFQLGETPNLNLNPA